ncbi:MAG: hypothetical protein DRN04_07800 [Thermoprotei archaeon]|nr:MAG: hypothetical protein DRN04_07800 [Thermoprotei archaeon]
MVRKKLLLLPLVLLALTLILPLNASPKAHYYYIYVKITTPVELKAGTPVVIKVKDLKAAVTRSYDWSTVYVLYGDTLVPSQVDKLGTSEDDYEIAFELVEDIPAGGSVTYKILVAEKGYKLPAPTYEEVCKVTIVPKYEDMAELGTGIVLENDLIKVVILNESDWIAGTVFSAIIKKTGYDVVKQGREKGSTGWRWSRYLAEGDPGWAEKNPRFKVLYMSTGPVRAVVVLQSTTPHGQLADVYAVKKYSVYKGWSYVKLELTVTGPGYKPGTKVPVKASFIDLADQGTNHDTVYVPGVGELSRMQGTSLRKENLTETWIAVYNKEKLEGFAVIFYPLGNLIKLEWGSPGAEIVLHYEEGIPIPFYRILVLFDKSVANDSFAYIRTVYSYSTADIKVEVVKEEEAKLLPVVVLEGAQKEIESLKSEISSLNNEIKNLKSQLAQAQSTIESLNQEISGYKSKISELESEISSLKSSLSTAQSMQGVLLVVGLVVGLAIGYFVGARKKKESK